MKLSFFIMITLCLFVSCRTTSHQLAYITNRDGNFDIYITDESGEKHTALTNNQGWDWSPKWNPALKGIIYNSNDTLDQFSIRLMSAMGQPRSLNTTGLEEFILSPNGKQALYTKSDSSFKYIYSYDLNTKKQNALIKHPSYNGRPQWSPDETMISFITDRDGNNELYVYKIEEKKAIRITKTLAREKYTSWSPDSNSILFTAQPEGEDYNDLFQVEISTLTIRQITDDQLTYEEICWSPDGKKIAFHAKRDGKHHIYTMNSDGTAEKQITKVDAYHGEPEWIPGE